MGECDTQSITHCVGEPARAGLNSGGIVQKQTGTLPGGERGDFMRPQKSEWPGVAGRESIRVGIMNSEGTRLHGFDSLVAIIEDPGQCDSI